MTQYNPQYPSYPPQQFAPPAPADPIDGPRRYPFFAGYVLWFKPDLWRDAGRRWGGVGILYMLILLGVTWAAVFAEHYVQFSGFFHKEIPEFIEQVPAIDIKDGVVSTDAKEPYIISNPNTGKAFIVIDTKGKITEPPKDEPSLLLTKNSVIYREANDRLKVQDLSEVKQFHMDRKDVQQWADKIEDGYWPIMFPGAWAVSMIYRLIGMLVFGLIGLAVAMSVRPPMKYSGLMRLAAIAMTPVILVDTIFMLTGLTPGCIWWIFGLVAEIGLLVAMIKANNDQSLSPYMPPMPGQPQYGYPPQGMAPQQYQQQPPAFYTPPPPPVG